MWLRDLSLAWRPKSLSGLPLAMENCLRHFPSTFAPYESCIRHSTLLDKIVLFSCLFPFSLASHVDDCSTWRTDSRQRDFVRWTSTRAVKFCNKFSFSKLDGGELVCGAVCAKRWPPLFCCCTLSRSTAAVEKPGDSQVVVPRLQLWVRVLSGNVLVAYDCG